MRLTKDYTFWKDEDGWHYKYTWPDGSGFFVSGPYKKFRGAKRDAKSNETLRLWRAWNSISSSFHTV